MSYTVWRGEWTTSVMTSRQLGSTYEDPTEPVTTAPVEITDHTTGSSNVTSSSSHGMRFYFMFAVLVVSVVGVAANALVLYGLVASKQHRKHALILLFSCFNKTKIKFLTSAVRSLICGLHKD